MKLFLDCYPCLLRQVLSLIRISGLDDAQGKTVVDRVLESLLTRSDELTSQILISETYEYVHSRYFPDTPVFDPYKKLKRQSNESAMSHMDSLESIRSESEDTLQTAIRLAAAGNIIDFGALNQEEIDINAEIEHIPDLVFSIFDIYPFREKLQSAQNLLYIGDNAGEIVFDAVCIRELKRQVPGMRITFAVRDKPVINDATLEDACFTGLDKEADVISSGCSYPGMVLEKTSTEFRALYDQADLIIAKGQGNYEGMSDVFDDRLFHILRIKCDQVSRNIGSTVGSLVLKQKCRTDTEKIAQTTDTVLDENAVMN